jgi:hypothetical protein
MMTEKIVAARNVKMADFHRRNGNIGSRVSRTIRVNL